jgi:hypothetical protein
VTVDLVPATPEVIIRLGAGAIFQNAFVLGTTDGVLGVNVLGNQAAVNLPSVQQISIRRGKDRVDGSFGAGTAAVQFIDFTGDWNPSDPNGPYFGELVPGRQLQIRVAAQTTGYNLFAGYITSYDWRWEPGVGFARVTLNAADALRQLELADTTTVSGAAAGDLPGTRINLILDENQWPATGRSVTTGTTTLQNDPGGQRSTLTALRQVEQSDLGALYVNQNGQITYQSRTALSTKAAGTPVVFDESTSKYTSIDVALDDTTIVNNATITPAGLTTQTATNSASVTKYFRRSVTRDNQLMETEARALQQAEAIVAARGEVNLTLRAIQFDVDSIPRMIDLVTTDIGDPVEVTRSYDGSDPIQFRSIVQGIRWDITPNRWRGTFSTTDTLALATAFVLGSPQFGVLGVNTLG